MRADRTAPAPATDTATQLGRLLALVPRIADGEVHQLVTIATTLGVDVRTVVRDLQAVGDRSAAPGGFIEGLQIFIEATQASVRTSHFLRPMRLTVAELHALDLGLAMLRGERPSSEWGAIDRARERIRAAVAALPGAPLPPSVHAASTAAADPARLDAVRRALLRRRKVRIIYRRGNTAAAQTRVVCPYRLIAAGPAWYLVAHCDRSRGLRIFRFDRIEQVQPLDEPFPPPDLAALDAQLERGPVFVSGTPITVRVRFSPRIARWIREREAGTEEPDGSYVVGYPLADVDWAVRHVLQYGPEAEVLDPPEARQAVRERLMAMLAPAAR